MIKPFLITQILEQQNRHLIYQGSSNRDEREEFNSALYYYLDTQPYVPGNIIRLFEVNKEVHLVYYWHTNLREPESNRIGIYLILGVSIPKKDFNKNKELMVERLMQLINNVMSNTKSSIVENADICVKTMWDMVQTYQPLSRLIQNILNDYNNSQYQIIDQKLLDYVNSVDARLFKKIDTKRHRTIKMDQARDLDDEKTRKRTIKA